MNMKDKHPWAWRCLVGSLLVAALAAFWGALGGSGCRSCEGVVVGIFQGKSLATLGTLYYGILFAAAVLIGPNLFVFSGIMIAAGVHGPLVAILFQSQLFCAPCLLAAAAAGAALVSALILEPSNAFRASLILPAAALALQTGLIFSGAVPMPREPRETKSDALRLSIEAREELLSPPVERGRARMVVYTRPDCGYCMELERDILPGLTRDFGPGLQVERRSAEALPGIPTPTIILTGCEKRRFFPGLPPVEDLRAAITSVMGDDHGRETVLEKSR
jgi:hypothetical protein